MLIECFLQAGTGARESESESDATMLSLHLQRSFACSALRSSARAYSSRPPLPPLPPQDQWRKHFPYVNVARRDRVFVRSPQAARAIAQSLFRSTPTSGKGKVVVEAFPGPSHLFSLPQSVLTMQAGPGARSRALLELPESTMRKLIILEDDPAYLQYLDVSTPHCGVCVIYN